jgi:hypothetical protein
VRVCVVQGFTDNGESVIFLKFPALDHQINLNIRKGLNIKTSVAGELQMYQQNWKNHSFRIEIKNLPFVSRYRHREDETWDDQNNDAETKITFGFTT